MQKNSPRSQPTQRIRGFDVFQGFLDGTQQDEIVHDLRAVIAKAPLFSPKTRWGKPMSVKMSSAGNFGWFTDHRGYRYIENHPSGQPWPKIPNSIMEIWRILAPDAPDPECCLINFYSVAAKMGLHQDKDEANFAWPVVSISLGDDALFRIGNTTKGGPTESIWLSSGDVVVIGGDARLSFHGVDKIRPTLTSPLRQRGRVNLTLRVVTH